MSSPQAKAQLELLPSRHSNPSPSSTSLDYIQAKTEQFLGGIKDLRDQKNPPCSSGISSSIEPSSTDNTPKAQKRVLLVSSDNLLDFLDKINEATLSLFPRLSNSTSQGTTSTANIPDLIPSSSASDLTQIHHNISSPLSSSQFTMGSESRRTHFSDYNDDVPTPDVEESSVYSSELAHDDYDYDYDDASLDSFPLPSLEHSTDNEHSPTDYDHDEYDHPLFVPGCSRGNAKQILSNSMLKAYVAMRGPQTKGAADPLVDWIKCRDDFASLNPPPGHRENVAHVLRMIDSVLESKDGMEETPRDSDAAFEIERPRIDHLEPPLGMDMGFNREQMINAAEPFDPDSDDEEAGIPSGRISPCTFLAWSKGCKRWDADKTKEYPSEDAKRLRPPTEEDPSTAKSHFPTYYKTMERQFDQHTGEELTPAYDVPRSPSIIYQPPGVPVDGMMPQSAGFISKFSRMNPHGAKELRNYVYGPRPAVPPVPAPWESGPWESPTVTQSEVHEAAQELDGVNAEATLAMYLEHQWATIGSYEAAEAAATAECAARAAELASLEAELGALRSLVPHVVRRRRAEEKAALDRAERDLSRARRRDLVRDHMAAYVRDTQHELDLAHMRADKARRRADADAAHARQLRDAIDELVLTAGAKDARDVFDMAYGKQK